MPEISYSEAVRDAMSEAMRRDEDVFIMGEDIAEMGGSMGVTQGMLDEFGPDRVRNTPISEMAIVGAGIGAADRRHAPDRRDHVPGLHDAGDGADRQPGGEAPLHVGRPDQGAAHGPHAGRRRLVVPARSTRSSSRRGSSTSPGSRSSSRRLRRTSADCSGARSTTTTRCSSSSTGRSTGSRARSRGDRADRAR